MVHGKSKAAELEPEAFERMKRLDAGFNVRLFSESSELRFGFTYHSDPVVSRVMLAF